MSLDASSASFHLSAPTSPSRINLNNIQCFYSLPTSPTWEPVLIARDDPETKTGSPRRLSYEDDADSDDLFEFEFHSARCFDIVDYELETKRKPDDKTEHQQENQETPRVQPPAMAFADNELLCKCMSMPLRPPPRLGYHAVGLGSTLPSQHSNLRIKKLWNDDFDPFFAAWKNVKEENSGKCQEKTHRRASSLLPLLRSISFQPNCSKPSLTSPDNQKRHAGGQQSVREVGKNTVKLTEPRRVLFERLVRFMKMDTDWTKKRPKSMLQETKTEAGENAKETEEEPCEMEKKSKRQFLFKSSLVKKMSNEDKQMDKAFEITKKPKGVCQVTEMTLAQCNPKLFLCMGGFGVEYSK